MSASTEHDDFLFDDGVQDDDEDADIHSSSSAEHRWAYYAVLMIDKQATTAEVNAAYKRLSLQFHPDKHISPAAKTAAENLFHRIKRARDVLCDDHLRRIYDALGSKGLEEFENKQMVRRDMKSSQEIIEEYERLLEVKRFQDEMNSYNPHATSEVHLDMSSVFESGYYGGDEDEDISVIDQLSDIDCTRMRLRQGFTFPIGQKDQLSIDSSLFMNFERRSNSTGSLSCLWRRLFPYGFVSNVGLILGNTSQLSWAVSKQISKHRMVSGHVTCDLLQGSMLIPGGGCTYSHGLSKRLRAEISATVGMSETVKCALIYSAETYSVTSSIQAGIAFTNSSQSPNSLSMEVVKSIPSQHVKCKLRAMISFSKYQMSVGFRKDIPTRQILCNTILQLDSDFGVKLNICLTRGRQKYILPIKMSSEIQPAATAYGLLLPTLVYAAARALLIIPYMNKQRQLQREKRKAEERENLTRRRSAATEEAELMAAAVQHIIAQEEERSGLVIVKALYGRLHGADQVRDDSSDDCVVNVTIPLQHQVKDSSLKIPSDVSKAEMPGFYDPCYAEEKKLYIRYKFHGKLHHVTLDDDEPISIPKQNHLISNAAGS